MKEKKEPVRRGGSQRWRRAGASDGDGAGARGAARGGGRRRRGSLAATTAAPGLFGLLLGRLLRHRVRRRDQHLPQKRDGRFFGQRGRTMDPLYLLRLALGESNNTR